LHFENVISESGCWWSIMMRERERERERGTRCSMTFCRYEYCRIMNCGRYRTCDNSKRVNGLSTCELEKQLIKSRKAAKKR